MSSKIQPTDSADLLKLLILMQRLKVEQPWAFSFASPAYDVTCRLSEHFTDRNFQWVYDAVHHLMKKYHGSGMF